MKPLPIGTMHIEVYNIEESPLHQIVKKLIYKKILDLEPYNFNNIYTGLRGNDLAQRLYGEYASDSGTFDIYGKLKPEKYSYTVRDAKQKEIREAMTWNDPKIEIILDHITKTGRQADLDYDPNPLHNDSRSATTYITLKPYKDKVFSEYAFFLDGLRIIPDITLMDEKGKPETVIEILYTGMPKAEKLIKYIESDLNVIFVFADQAIKGLAINMTCRRDYFSFPIREAWLAGTPKKEKISRAINILLQKKLKGDEFIISKNKIKNTQYDPSNKWKKDRMNIGLRMKTSSDYHMRETETRDLSHSMAQMKETSSLIILLRYLIKHNTEIM